MGGLLQFFEFNQGRMAKKVHGHKKHHGGLEPPRNSLDQQVEAYQNHYPEGELPHYYQVEEDRSENSRYSNAGSMKKLINEELSKQSSTVQNAPSLVARLMGIDMLPVDTKSVIPSDKRISENVGKKFRNKGKNGRGSVSWESSNFNSSSQIDFGSFYEYIDHDDDNDGWNRSFGKPRSREHPQEEELQKFKKDFETYQAVRFLQCSKVAEVDGVSRQENLNKEKVAHNTSSQRAPKGKLARLDSHSFKTELPNNGGSEYHGVTMDLIPDVQRKIFPSKSRTLSRDFEESLMMKSYNRSDTSSPPTRIVILKPGPDSICSHGENWTGSPGTLPGRHSIEDFLEEVKERLKCELQGKTVKKGSVVRGSEIEILRNKKSSDPKLIARQIVKQVSENVTRDADSNLVRSESTRSYKGEMQFDGLSFPEYISRDTRRLLSERLRNAVENERHDGIPEGNSRSHSFDNHRVRLKQEGDILKCANDWEISKEETEIQTRSFRHELDDNMLLHRDLSPRNLVRSLSAPVSRSGTSFGKLLLEDRHILTGAHIQRKLEAVETMSVDVKKRRKDRFNIKEKVSHFRYSLALRGRLFGKRTQSLAESNGNEYGHMVRDVTSGPTVLVNCGDRHENSTEVPPSPASVCSSVHEDFWRRTEYLSPISTPDVYSRDDMVPQVFRDISSGLNELRRQINQLESDGPKDSTTKQEPSESELVQLKDPAESYIRDLLVASGLYFGSWNKSLLKGDTYGKPIGNSVFEEVEETHKKLVKECDESSIKDQNENKLDHRILLDLLNEALSVVLGPPLTFCRFKRKLCNFSMLPPPIGKELLKSVWDRIYVSLYPPSDISHCSLDSLVGRHLRSIPWSGLINDEINILEREIECFITNDLIEELTRDVL